MSLFTGLMRVTLAMITALAAGAGAALACTCPPLEDAAAQAETHDLVAVVTVGAHKEFGQTPYGTPERIETRIKVREVLKDGEMTSLVLTTQAPGNPACGIVYRQGAEIVLLANEMDGSGYSAWMCSAARFSEDEFRTALGKPRPLAPLTGTVEIVSPRPGAQVAGPLMIQGTLPRDWFFENTASGRLMHGGAMVGEIPIRPVSSQNWTEPGDKTIDLEVTLTNPEDMDLTLVIEQSMVEDGLAPRTVSVPFTALAAGAE